MGEANIPTIDFSTFLKEDEDGKKKAMEEIFEASCEYGFFQIVNHEISLDLIKEAMQVSKMFFDYPYEEKNKSKGSASCGAPVPHGYNRQPDHAPDKNEYFAMFPPGSSFNVFPSNPPNFRDLLEEIYEPMSKMGVLMESVINDCLGLPTNLLKDFNDDRSWDYLVAFHYAPATNVTENFGIIEHEDSNCLTFIISNEVEGLEIRKNGKWIPVIPAKGTIVVNIGDVIQVLSNKKFKSATHRVVKPKERSRYSIAYFHNVTGDKWIEPLPQFTKDIEEPPKYKGFIYKDYLALRKRNKTHPPSRPEDVIHITHYEIDS